MSMLLTEMNLSDDVYQRRSLTLDNSLMSVAQEALTPVFTAKFLCYLVPCTLDYFGITNCKRRESDYGE